MEEMEAINSFIQDPHVMASCHFKIFCPPPTLSNIFLSATERYPLEKDILQAMLLNKLFHVLWYF